MKHLAAAIVIAATFACATAQQEGRPPRRRPTSMPAAVKPLQALSVLVARPTDSAVTLNILSAAGAEALVEYGPGGGESARTAPFKLVAASPMEVQLQRLTPDSRYSYRLLLRRSDNEPFTAAAEGGFQTRRAPGSTFIFEVQGDSHPERVHQFDPNLYVQTLKAAAADKPDFYFTMGDDFSVDALDTIGEKTVEALYRNQRAYLSLVGRVVPLMLVNGNHEQAAMCNLDGKKDNAAVLAQTSRNRFFSPPAPDEFYSGDKQPVDHIGLLRDYYAWTWGDALFMVIDPYWHSPKPVDNVLGGGPKNRDLWDVTLGKDQYDWLRQTLLSSKAKYKFVFTHHVLGTGRGGVEQAGLFEWGGRDKKGADQFAARRPGWEMPIHQLMVKAGVTIFFQGHDHVFARQLLDGVTYQTLPEPADPTYTLYNKGAFRSGDVLPSSGRLRVTVGPQTVRVEYVRSYLPKDATAEHPDGKVAFAYEVPPARGGAKDSPSPTQQQSVAIQARPLAEGFEFTEGPAVAKDGSVVFSDVHASRTYRWADGKAAPFREKTGGANGLAYDKDGKLLICEGANGRVVSLDSGGKITVVADRYAGKRFNQPNDLWIDPHGGVYFSDPLYGRGEKVQDGEHVYYVSPDRTRVVRVIDDMVRPNGLCGTPDGKTLYVADHGAGKTWRYTINADGTLAGKTLFASSGSDGLKVDADGNVYLTTDAVVVYDSSGTRTARIEVPQRPTNLCFTGQDRKTLFITAGTAIYSASLAGGGPAWRGQTQGRARGPQGTFNTQTPAHAMDVILGRPTDTSVTLSVLSYADARVRAQYGTSKDKLTAATDVQDMLKGQPKEIVLDHLAGDTQYYYRLFDAAGPALPGGEGTFHTQRADGKEFLFTVQADSHLDENAQSDLYAQTLKSAAADGPDFHVDLGDTFMVDKHPSRETAAAQYLAQRYYLGLIGRAAPVFLTLGNHDGEDAKLLRGDDSLGAWATAMRSRYFPNPQRSDFYGPSTLGNYYRWQWGEALFVVLDPYRYSTGRKGDNWRATLGRQQYDWLKSTLESSKAKWKFVFCHQLVGGADEAGRGGIEAAGGYEWGGANADGTRGFEKNRTGWPMPIHDLLVKNHVTIFFHGHDHFYARQDLDGVIYQLVPQPACPAGRADHGARYGYAKGVIKPSSGYLRVKVSPSQVQVQYVQPQATSAGAARLAHSYQVQARP
ncbi:MAG: SMP-30/gluconolactonase/LRE family protein [Planctomycetaceae bacterium]|nr:SMP-30/gluconolactonase/LRE family protein [Planctomycetaceae bacterium]